MVSRSNNNNGEIIDITGVDSSLLDSLRNAGFDSIGDIKAASQSELAEVTGISKLAARRIKSQVGGANAAMDGHRDNSQTDRSTKDLPSVDDSDDTEITAVDSSESVSVSTTQPVDEHNNIPLTAFSDDSVSEDQFLEVDSDQPEDKTNETDDPTADSEDILEDLVGEFDELTEE